MSRLRILLISVIAALILLSTLPLATITAQDDPQPAGDRILAIDVLEADGEDYDAAFQTALALGMQQVGVSQDWTDIETAPGEYDDSILSIVNIYYPAYGVPIDLTLRPIHTGTLRLPDDLADKPFDDPEVIARFNALLDFVAETLPDTELSSLVIGSELDGYLGDDITLWEQYIRFAMATAFHAKTLWPDVPIAFEVMYDSFTTEPVSLYVETLNQFADVIGVSYYPHNNFVVRDPETVFDAFELLTTAYPDKPIYFYQYGYPSSPLLESSEALQEEFIRTTFAAWDMYPDQVQMIDFTWMTDRADESLEYFQEYYNYFDERFAAFLGSLGLRNRDGTAKPAFTALEQEAAARGWGG